MQDEKLQVPVLTSDTCRVGLTGPGGCVGSIRFGSPTSHPTCSCGTGSSCTGLHGWQSVCSMRFTAALCCSRFSFKFSLLAVVNLVSNCSCGCFIKYDDLCYPTQQCCKGLNQKFLTATYLFGKGI